MVADGDTGGSEILNEELDRELDRRRLDEIALLLVAEDTDEAA